MKKTIMLVLAALLVLVFAVGAYADAKWTYSGNYRTQYWYRNNKILVGDSLPGFGSVDTSKESFWTQRFRNVFKIMPNDKTTFNLYLQALNGNWGADVANASGGGVQSYGTYTAANDTTGSIYIRYANAEIASDYGTFTLGRQSMGYEGLSAMGYASPLKHIFGYGGDIFDAERPGDRFKWAYKTGPLTVGFAFDKYLEGDAQRGGTLTPTGKDYDVSGYTGWLDYRFANGGFWFDYVYTHNGAMVNGGNINGNAAALGTLSAGLTGGANWNWTTHTFNPAAFMDFGPFRIAGEIKYITGKLNSTVAADPTIDLRGAGYYLEGTYNFGAGNVALTYYYLQGDDNTTDNKLEQQVDNGGDWFPFIVALWGGVTPRSNAAIYGGQTVKNSSNHQMIAASANYNVTEDLMLHGAFGYFKINELTPAQSAANWDKDFGYELDLALKYKVMPNLTYAVQGGYFWTGDYMKAGNNNLDTGNAWTVMNEIVMTW